MINTILITIVVAAPIACLVGHFVHDVIKRIPPMPSVYAHPDKSFGADGGGF